MTPLGWENARIIKCHCCDRLTSACALALSEGEADEDMEELQCEEMPDDPDLDPVSVLFCFAFFFWRGEAEAKNNA